MLEINEHEVRGIAQLLDKLMKRAKKNKDRTSIIYLETIIKLFDTAGLKVYNKED